MRNQQAPIVLSPDAHHVLESFARKHKLTKNQTLGRMVALLEAIQEQEEQGRSLAFAEVTSEGEVQAVRRISGLM